jgi:hypothetical protein
VRWQHSGRRQWRSEGNSPRGSLSGGEGRSRARDGGRLASTFGVIDDELQLSVGDRIR